MTAAPGPEGTNPGANVRRTVCLAACAAALALALALAGCKKHDSVEVKNASVETVANKIAASSIKPKPGQWTATVKIDKIDLPNLPPQAKAMMAQQMGKTHTAVTCLTADQANKPDASFFQQAAKDCKYDHFSMNDGKIDARMVCKRGATSQTVAMNGTYSETSYDMAITTQGEAQPGMPMTMAMSVSSKRTGDCTAKQPS